MKNITMKMLFNDMMNGEFNFGSNIDCGSDNDKYQRYNINIPSQYAVIHLTLESGDIWLEDHNGEVYDFECTDEFMNQII